MTDSPKPHHDFPLDASVPLSSILCTEELRLRPSRPPDYAKENRALVTLARALADSNSNILQVLTETILDVAQCDSSGLSLLTKNDGGKRFYWPAIAGAWKPHTGSGVLRNCCPCGDALDRECALLFRHFERRYTAFLPIMPSAEECLIIPFYVDGKAVGTMWAIMHSDRHKFDAEDERIMTALGQFAAVAYQTLASIEDLKVQVAAREEAETALRRLATGLEAKMRSLVDSNIMGIFTWNLDGAIVEANERFLTMVQYRREDLASGNMRWTDLTPPEWRARDEIALANIVATGTVQPYRKELFRRDGSRVPVLACATLREQDGSEGVAFVLDLSEQTHAEEAHRRVEQQARSIVDSALDAVVAMDIEGIITDWNKQAEEIFGWRREEVLGRRMSQTIIPQHYRAAHDRGLRHFLETGQGAVLNRRIEITALRRNGQQFPVELSVTPLKLADSWSFHAFIRDITDRKLAEEALRASEQSLGLIINTIPTLAWAARTDGFADFFNQHYLDYVGLSTEQAKGWGWTTAVHPDDLAGLSDYWQAIMSTGKAGEYEARLRRFDGAYRWFLFRAQALRDRSGTIVKWYGTNSDIEDRKRAEDALRASERSLRDSEQSLRLIVDTMPALVCTLKPDWEVEHVNQRLLDYFGKTLDDLMNWAFIRVVHPDDLEAATALTRHSEETGQPYEVEHRYQRHDGTFRWFHVHGLPLRNAEGQIVRWYIALIDIEDRKRAVETLRESEVNLRRMTETIPAMLWSATPEGVIDYCNAQFLNYTGFSPEQVMSDGWKRTIHPDDAERVAPVWLYSVKAGTPYRVEVRTFRAVDRTYRWCLVTALPLLNQQGRISKWYGTIVDMHDWKRAQEELRNTQAELAHMTRVMTMGELTASIAHEVNQPLAAVIASGDSCTAWLSNVPPNLDKARAAADRVVQAATQASAVIQRIRTMFKKTPAVRTSLKINEVIEEAISLIHTEVLSKRISLRIDLSDSMPLVSGDRVQIAQVILNLAINGIEAMAQEDEQARWLLIRSAPVQSKEIHVSIADGGPGLNPKITSRLFDPFFTTKSGGIGMGLSISRSIIEAHGGRLWAAANEPRGAVFHFALPATAKE